MRKNIWHILIALIAPILVAGVSLILIIFLIVVPPNMPEHPEAEAFLQSNQELIYIVKDYLLNSGFDTVSISWPNTAGGVPLDTDEILMLPMSGHGHIPVEDEAVIEALHHLFQYTRRISKHGNSINFLTWSARNHGRGIAYSIDGSIPDRSGLTFLTHIEPLSVEGWYFYVEDFNEYRHRMHENP